VTSSFASLPNFFFAFLLFLPSFSSSFLYPVRFFVRAAPPTRFSQSFLYFRPGTRDLPAHDPQPRYGLSPASSACAPHAPSALFDSGLNSNAGLSPRYPCPIPLHTKPFHCFLGSILLISPVPSPPFSDLVLDAFPLLPPLKCLFSFCSFGFLPHKVPSPPFRTLIYDQVPISLYFRISLSQTFFQSSSPSRFPSPNVSPSLSPSGRFAVFPLCLLHSLAPSLPLRDLPS